MRKYILFLLGILIIPGMVLVACGTPAEPVAEEPPAEEQPAAEEAVVEEPAAEEPAAEESAESMSAYHQSPFLDGKDLPPVDERLPANPQVVVPLAGEGQQYGGNMRVGFTGGSPAWGGVFYITQWY